MESSKQVALSHGLLPSKHQLITPSSDHPSSLLLSLGLAVTTSSLLLLGLGEHFIGSLDKYNGSRVPVDIPKAYSNKFPWPPLITGQHAVLSLSRWAHTVSLVNKIMKKILKY